MLRLLHDFEILPMKARLMPLLEPACATSNGRWTGWDAMVKAMARDVFIWVAERMGEIIGIAVTSLQDYPGGKAARLHVGTTITGTTAREWRFCMAQLVEWARENGCRWFESEARAGWERVFAGTMKKTHVFLEMELT